MGDHKEIQLEEDKLQYTLRVIEKELENNNKAFSDLYGSYGKNTSDPQVVENLSKIYAKRIRDLNNALEKPYFARIDFKEDGKTQKEELYIGKTNIMKDTENIVIDWRAPISSLYYDGRLGNVEYTAPGGTISGELLLKRIYEISKGKLESFSDIDISANDELLKPYLSTNSDNRLKNIISTIQSEQNKIIRAPLRKPLIVQGVAGSGKTTVALHRIAYLAYTYEKDLKPEEFMIIAPNNFFLDYISAILPDLGVNDVKQLTFEEFAQSIIESGIKIENSNNKLAHIVNTGSAGEQEIISQDIASFKSSFEFKEMLDRYLENIEENYLPDTDITVNELTILSHDKLVENFKDCTMREVSLEERLDIFKYKLSVFFENNEETITDGIRAIRRKELNEIDTSLPSEEYKKEKIRIFEKYEPDIALVQNKGKKILNNYLKQIKKNNALDYYKDFISKLDKYVTPDAKVSQEVVNKIQSDLLEKKNNKKVEYEDLAPLMYIANSIKGNGKNISDDGIMPKHIVIDEAQDYSPFQFFVLKDILKNNSMTILGDIAQGIYAYRGTKDWNEVNEKAFNEEANILELNKSYRTTVEIMDIGNNVIDSIKDEISVKLAEPVIRRGSPVHIEKKKNSKHMIQDIALRLMELQASENKNIAVITKTLQEAKALEKKVNATGIEANLLSDKETEYKGGISIIPSYLTKGLEFDSVIIADANKESYDSNELDAKLLYIAITRAMHTLDIYYTGEMSELLNEREEKSIHNKQNLDDEREDR